MPIVQAHARRHPSVRVGLWIALAVLLACAGAATSLRDDQGALRRLLHAVDRRWLDEALMDWLARWKGQEDWRRAERLSAQQDDAWTRATPAPIRIAHALGEAGKSGANSLSALARAHADGIRVFEVDLRLDGGVLRCEHDEAPLNKAVDSNGDPGCRLETLMAALPADSWLVLDIKTEFAAAGEQVMQVLKQTGRARQIVFQLYRPEQLALFNRWQALQPLSAPIVTAYRSHRAVNHIAAALAQRGVHDLALPLERLPAMTERPPGLRLHVHPVHTCQDLLAARSADVSGVYVLGGLTCDGGEHGD